MILTTLSKLNPQQQRAVETTQGRVLILAGAGSGKTSVLVQRIAHLLKTGVAPENILGLTFTNKAAGEMRERVGKAVGKASATKVTLSTFHSFCMKILRKEIHHLGYTSNFTIYDERDIKRVLKQLVRDELAIEGELPSIESTYATLSTMRNKGLGPTDAKQKLTQTIYTKLETMLRAYNAVDFDTLLTLTVQILEQHPDILTRYQDTYQYIMIDEYQDTNPIQYRLADLLSKKYNNLCVVGDDDQSIYGWRGAEVEHILHFRADTTIKLEQNYRSTPMILHAANAVIKHNEKRHAKTLFSEKEQGVPIAVFHAPSEEAEAEACVKRIIHFRTELGARWSDFAILYRSNILARTYEKALLNAMWKRGDTWIRGVPYTIVGGTELFERAEVKDVLAFIRVIANPKDQEALLRVINVPRRGISEKTLDAVTSYQRSHSLDLYPLLTELSSDFALQEEIGITARGIQGISSFVEHVEQAKASKRPLHETLESFLTDISYKKAIEEDVKSESMRSFKWENVLQAIASLKTFEEQTENPTFASFAAESSLNTFANQEQQAADSVTMMTFHSAKGLEFPYVFLVGMEDHLIPHEKSLLETGIEEERRLVYVAITRAKERLFMSMAQTRKRFGRDQKSSPSRFLHEIPRELLSFEKHNLIL